MKNIYQSSEETKAPLSSAIEINWVIFISWQIHADENWNLIWTSIDEKFDIITWRIKKILSEAGLDISNIFKVNIYIKDISELPKLNEAYNKVFNHPMPVRTAIWVKDLPLNADLEIECNASR